MSDTASGLLDTSVFIARETGQRLKELPARVAVSVITIGELQPARGLIRRAAP